MDFRAQLRRQLGLLEDSCRLYDEGRQDEAIRIATAIRVLLHQTNNSTSLLTHLNSTTINLLSTTNDLSKDSTATVGLGKIHIENVGDARFLPMLGGGTVRNFVPISEWWNQVVYVLNPQTKLSRRKIVLSAANQDGGAHVDTALGADYEALARDGALAHIEFTFRTKSWRIDLSNAHLVSLRQMAYELLNSPELRALAA
jgi:hypothetical protein